MKSTLYFFFVFEEIVVVGIFVLIALEQNVDDFSFVKIRLRENYFNDDSIIRDLRKNKSLIEV